jgi:hypothetical protein
MAEAFHGKMRAQQAYLTVASSGPITEPKLKQLAVRSRMAADLRWTSADGAVLDKYWRDPTAYDADEARAHILRIEPTMAELLGGLQEAASWLARFRNEPDWDGGALNINFAGHGRAGDGALCLKDGEVDPDSLLAALAQAHDDLLSGPHRLRVSLMLDSCHSGAFLIRFICGSWERYSEKLYPFASTVACMHNEVAWEADRFGHGLMSYGLALQDDSIDVGPRPRLDISLLGISAQLDLFKGIPFLTAARQNPVIYYEYGDFDVGGNSFEISTTEPSITAIETALDGFRRRQKEDVDSLRRFLEPGVSLKLDFDNFESQARDSGLWRDGEA